MNLYLSCISFFLLSAGASLSAAQGMTRSESLLGGLERVDNKTVWPETIDLPKAWRDGFKILIKKNLETGREHAACLSVTTNEQGSLDASSALIAYQDLLTKQKTITLAAFETESARLRKIIEGGKEDSQKQPAQLIWKIGQQQAGTATSIQVEHGLMVCDSTTIGDVHTHPTYIGGGMQSRSDLVSSVLNEQRSFTVDLAGNTCMFIPSDPSINKIKATRLSVLQTHDLIALSKSLDPTVNTYDRTNQQQADEYASRMGASFAAMYGGKLYCGNVDSQLKLIAPLSVPTTVSKDQGFILAAKAMTITMKRLYQPDWPEINFPFTPVFDGEFVQYIKSVYSIYGISASAVDKFIQEAKADSK